MSFEYDPTVKEIRTKYIRLDNTALEIVLTLSPEDAFKFLEAIHSMYQNLVKGEEMNPPETENRTLSMATRYAAQTLLEGYQAYWNNVNAVKKGKARKNNQTVVDDRSMIINDVSVKRDDRSMIINEGSKAATKEQEHPYNDREYQQAKKWAIEKAREERKKEKLGELFVEYKEDQETLKKAVILAYSDFQRGDKKTSVIDMINRHIVPDCLG